MLLTFLHETEPDILDFLEEATIHQWTKLQIGKIFSDDCSKKQFEDVIPEW
jgi:hypothetical protein